MRHVARRGVQSAHRPTNTTAAIGAARMFGGWREVLVDEADSERARAILAEAEVR